MREVTWLPRPPTLRFRYQSCHVGWGSGRNQPYQVSSKSVQGVWWAGYFPMLSAMPYIIAGQFYRPTRDYYVTRVVLLWRVGQWSRDVGWDLQYTEQPTTSVVSRLHHTLCPVHFGLLNFDTLNPPIWTAFGLPRYYWSSSPHCSGWAAFIISGVTHQCRI